MPVQTKLSVLFNALEERLPKETGIAKKAPPHKQTPLFNPEFTLKKQEGLQRQLEPFGPPSGKQVRETQGKRFALAIDRINKHIRSSNQFKGIRFDIHEESNRSFAVVKEIKTGRVLKMIPPEGVLEIAANLRDASGLFVNRKG